MEDATEKIVAAIAALDAQRALLGDAVVDMAVAPLRRELAARQANEPRARQQLKQVSVLFVDVVGSTAMGQQLEPEDIHAVMDGALTRFTAVAEAQHGRVLQYTGDGMLAAFGTQEASEDDVESAIRAGLGIIEEARQQAPEVRQRHGVKDFNVRAGVHTGTVLLGGGVDAEGSIRGATVNLAARMEQSAPTGRLRISHDSYRHVHGLFEVTEQAPISVKGVDQPVRSYLVDSAKPRAFRVPTRGIEGLPTPMVGRAAELDVLLSAFAAARATHQLRSVAIVGEAGIGKSRLLAEFHLMMNLRTCWLLLARAEPRSALQPYFLLRDMLMREFQIGETEPAEQARSKFARGLATLFAGAGDAPIHLLGHLIGLDFSASPHVKDVLGDERQFRSLAFDAAADCLRRLSATKPVVVVVDDLHWADEGSLDILKFLFAANHDTPLLGLMLTRPTFFEQHPDWAVGNPYHTRIELHPLNDASSRELAGALLQRLPEVPDALSAVITGGAEGNPFYMEELVKMLIDDGVIVTEPQGWRVLPDKLLRARVPATLTGVLQARLDVLRLDERTALQQAAVVGHVFWDQALAAIDPAALGALPALLRKQYVVRRDPTADTGEYAFQHQLLHQVTYDSVLKEPRLQGHARAGAFWSARAEVAGPQGVNPGACRALAEAHAHRRLSDPAALAAWFDAQFSNYLNAYASQTLWPLAGSVVTLCEQHHGPGHVETARALTNLARVAVMLGETQMAEPALRRALTIQEQTLGPDHTDTARTLAVLGGCFQGRGEYAMAEQFFRRALEVRERVLGFENPLTLGTADIVAHLLSELGRLDEAEQFGRRVLQVREQTLGPEALETASALTGLGELLAKKGDLEAAEALLRRSLAVQQRSLPADSPDIGLTLWHLAEALRGLGRYAEAEPHARRTLEISEQSFGANHEWTAWGLISLAEVRLAQGAADEAAGLAQRAGQILERVFGATHAVLGSTLNLHGRALLAAERYAAAESTLTRALAIQSVPADNPHAPATEQLLVRAREQRAGQSVAGT